MVPRLIFQAPLGRQRHFTQEMEVLAQDTKERLVPRAYVLLLGDSHAKGFGDWLLSADISGRAPYHSAHVLRAELGREVLSFGEGGLGSVDALVRRPRQRSAALARFGLGPPEQIVVYFYAGNDLQDNDRDLSRVVRDGADADRIEEPEYLDALLRRRAERDLAWWRRWRSTFFAGRYAGNLLEVIAERGWSLTPLADPARQPVPMGRTTRARVGGRERWLPDRLQSPALGLGDAAWRRALLVLERSLASLRELYPRQPILVAYLPSPLSCYEITSSSVSAARGGGGAEVHPTGLLERRGRETRRRVAEIAALRGLDFLDLTPPLREAAAQEPVHGPLDWDHPNERGYRAIGHAVAGRLAADAPALRDPASSRLQ